MGATFAATIASVLLVAAAASAQPRVAFVGGLTGFGLPGGFGAAALTAGARVNLSDRTAIEGGADFVPGGSGDLGGFYNVEVSRSLSTRAAVVPFVAGGLLGDFAVGSHDGLRGAVSPPLGLVGGGGVRIPIAAGTFVETGAQVCVWPGTAMVFRLTAAFSVPLGSSK